MKQNTSTVHIEKMTIEDISHIKFCFSEKFDKFWSIETLKNDFEDEHSTYIVARIENEIVGFAGLKIVCNIADIMNIAVHLDKRNLGIGSLLLEKLIFLANLSNCSKIMLEVNKNNTAALCLYTKYGFKQLYIRKNYYHQTDDAIIMEKVL